MTRLELRECWTEKLQKFDPKTNSFAAFCRARELNYQNALNWRRKLNLGNSTEKLDFAEVVFPSSDIGDFILRRRGWEILVPAHFADQTLCNAPRLSRTALRRSGQKMKISFFDSFLRRPILS